MEAIQITKDFVDLRLTRREILILFHCIDEGANIKHGIVNNFSESDVKNVMSADVTELEKMCDYLLEQVNEIDDKY